MDENQKKGHVVAILVMIIALLVAVLISIFVSQNIGKSKDEPKEVNTSTENTDNKVEPKKEEDSKEEEVSIDKYSYLLDRIYPNNCSIRDLSDYLDLDKMSDGTKVSVAMAQINSNDGVYKAVDIEKEVKNIFGKNVDINHKSNGSDLIYDTKTNTYRVESHGCLGDSIYHQEITKITTTKDKLYIYVVAGSSSFGVNEQEYKLCYDYDYNNSKTSCINTSKLDKKYVVSDTIAEYEFDYIKYMKDNKDKFAKYKYTFEKEDNNYIIKKLEKID